MSVLAGLSSDAQLVRRKGDDSIITRVHIDPEIGEADGFEVVAPVNLFIEVGAYDALISGHQGWRRFWGPEGVAYVHASAEAVEELAASL